MYSYDKAAPGLNPIEPEKIAEQGWNILEQDVCFPVAILREQRILHNLQWMQRFIDTSGVHLYPHGKTTMAPALFQLQMEYGCRGLTAANPTHLAVYLEAGIERVILANQVVGKANLRKLFFLLQRFPKAEVILIVDSIAGAEILNDAAQRHGHPGELTVLLEVGGNEGRTGVRSLTQALELARGIEKLPHLRLCGVEAFEAVFPGSNQQEQVASLLSAMIEIFESLDAEGLLQGNKHYLSAGGSAYYDMVVERFNTLQSSKPVEILLRSGCYITHDDGMYRRAIDEIFDRGLLTFTDRLKPALEVWGVVQSLPEPGLAFSNVGKRDISYDVEMPLARYHFRPGRDTEPKPLHGEIIVTGLNDQHTYLRYEPQTDLRVGDLIGFGVSHPCTTFDKWKALLLVNEEYTVLQAISTYF